MKPTTGLLVTIALSAITLSAFLAFSTQVEAARPAPPNSKYCAYYQSNFCKGRRKNPNRRYPTSPCPKDAKVCPDGTAVGRVGPFCQFAACPR